MVWWMLGGCFLLFDGDTEGQEPGDCSDAADNDGDGDFDCNDAGCFGSPVCEPVETSGPPVVDDPDPTDPPDPTTPPDPTAPGDLDVQWRFSNGLGCAANDVFDVGVAVFDGPDLLDGFPLSLLCDDGGAQILDLEPMRIEVSVAAFGPDGFSGPVTHLGIAEAELLPDEVVQVMLVLEPTE